MERGRQTPPFFFAVFLKVRRLFYDDHCCHCHSVGGRGHQRDPSQRPEALQVVGRCFRPFNGEDLAAKPGYTACYGRFVHADGSVLDDGVVLVYHAPHSYTGEDVAELSCHGGVYVTRQLLRRCLECGAVAAQPGEFTRRAFLNGKMDLTQAESVMEVIGAQNQQSLRTARAQMEGALYRQVVECKDALLELCAYLSAWADYPEEDIPALEESSLLPNMKEINAKFSKLLENYDNGRMLTQGIRTAIVGKPNVGKSTLMNLFSGYQRSIVTDIAGHYPGCSGRTGSAGGFAASPVRHRRHSGNGRYGGADWGAFCPGTDPAVGFDFGGV